MAILAPQPPQHCCPRSHYLGEHGLVYSGISLSVSDAHAGMISYLLGDGIFHGDGYVDNPSGELVDTSTGTTNETGMT